MLGACSSEKPTTNAIETANAAAPIINVSNAAAPTNASEAAPKPAEIPKVEVPAPSPAASPSQSAQSLAYRALGTEPFWSVTVRGSILVLERPDAPARRFAVQVSGKGEATRFTGDAITMAVTPGPCSDGMSEFTYADRVQVTLADGVLKGCGGERRGPEE